MDKNIKKIIPYGKQTVTEEDISKVVEVLKSPFLTQGPVVKEFEKAIALKTNSKYSLSFNSATSALHIACLALGLKEGDWLWTSPTTFVASSNCGLYCKANIDFVDIDSSNGLINIEELSNKLEKAKKLNILPKILIPVHLAGSSCDMKKIKKLSEIYGFHIIEDASHALGGKFEGTPVGSCKYSSICVFSCHPVKIITSGEGGIATTNDSKLYETMEELRSHGITKRRDKLLKDDPEPWFYEQQKLGFNYRITDIQSALGLSQLKRLDLIVKERNRLFLIYQNLLKELPLKMLDIPANVTSSIHLAIVSLKIYNPKIHREIFEELQKKGIGVQVHYIPVHLHPYYRNLGFKEGDFPNAERYSKNCFSIPLFPGLTEDEQNYVVEQIKNTLKYFHD